MCGRLQRNRVRVGLSSRIPRVWGVRQNRPKPFLISHQPNKSLRSVSVDECDESLAICVVSPERARRKMELNMEPQL